MSVIIASCNHLMSAESQGGTAIWCCCWLLLGIHIGLGHKSEGSALAWLVLEGKISAVISLHVQAWRDPLFCFHNPKSRLTPQKVLPSQSMVWTLPASVKRGQQVSWGCVDGAVSLCEDIVSCDFSGTQLASGNWDTQTGRSHFCLKSPAPKCRNLKWTLAS